MDSAEILARELADLNRRLKALERGTQLTSSTIGTSAGTVSIVSGLEAGLSAGAAAAEALQKAASAEAKADGAVHTYFGDEAPELNVHIGDFWRRPDGVIFQFDGEDWVELSGTDPELAKEVAEALDRLAHAEEALDGKVTTYFLPARQTPPEPYAVGDLWVVSDLDNMTRRWDGEQWVDLKVGWNALDEDTTARIEGAEQDAATAIANAASAQATADGAVVTFFGSTEPDDVKDGAKDGDLWYYGGVVKQRVGGEWVRVDEAVNNTLAGVTNSLSATNSNVANLQSSLNTTNSNVSSMQSGLSFVTDAVEDVQTGLNAANANVSNMQSSVTNMQSSVTNMQSSLTDALGQLEDTVAAVDGKITTYIGPSAQLPQCTNFVSNGGFENGGVGWSTDSYFAYNSASAYTGKGGCRITTSTSGNVYPRNSVWNTVAPGELLTMTVMMRVVSGSVKANGAGVVVRFGNTDGTTTSWQVGRTTDAPTASSTGWKMVQATYTVPAGANRAQAGFWLEKTAAAATVDIDNIVVTGSVVDTSKLQIGDLWVVTDKSNLVRRWDGKVWADCTVGSNAIANNAITSTKISNNAVTAPKLEANLVLASRIIAGNQNGNHAEMNSTGFHGFNGTREVMSLGVDGSSDYMSFVKNDGTVAASLTQTGTLNANGVSAGSKLWYQGREFTDVTDDMPLGLLAISRRNTRGNVATGQNVYQPFMRIDAILLPGRLYKVTIGPAYTVLSGGGVMGVAIYANYGQVGQIRNGVPTGDRIGYVKCRTNHDIITPLSIPFEVTGDTSQAVSFMFCYCNLATAGQVTLQPDDLQPCPCYCMIEDLGVKYRTVSKGHAGAINLPNSNAILPPQTPSVVDVQPSDRKNYYVSGNTATAVTVSGQTADTMYQGPWEDHGRRYMSAVRFADLPTLLTGVDIKGMMLCVNAKQWHYGNGGTVTLAPHGWNSLPSSFNISSLPTFRIESASFPNPGYRYIPIPAAIWNGFKTGTYRGFVFVGDESLDSTALFGNDTALNASYQLPFLQIGGTSMTGSVN